MSEILKRTLGTFGIHDVVDHVKAARQNYLVIIQQQLDKERIRRRISKQNYRSGSGNK